MVFSCNLDIDADSLRLQAMPGGLANLLACAAGLWGKCMESWIFWAMLNPGRKLSRTNSSNLVPNPSPPTMQCCSFGQPDRNPVLWIISSRWVTLQVSSCTSVRLWWLRFVQKTLQEKAGKPQTQKPPTLSSWRRLSSRNPATPWLGVAVKKTEEGEHFGVISLVTQLTDYSYILYPHRWIQT